jgi:hypothetical protein
LSLGCKWTTSENTSVIILKAYMDISHVYTMYTLCIL